MVESPSQIAMEPDPIYLSTEWVDYVEEPMKYQALRPHFFIVGGGGGVLVRDVVGGG